jgi:predicted CopG family antitoxin
MVKVNRTISIEADVWEDAQRMYPGKLSGMFQEFLIDLTAGNEEDQSELIQRFQQIQKEEIENKIEKERIQKKLELYKEESERKKELFEGEEAKKRKQAYMDLRTEIRTIVGDIVNQVQTLKLKDWNLYPFIFYYEILLNEEKLKELFLIAETNNYFELTTLLKSFSRQINKEVED